MLLVKVPTFYSIEEECDLSKKDLIRLNELYIFKKLINR